MARERKFHTEDLFQATKQLLLQHGYEGFTFSLLADRLEVSRGALYKYYENKEDLITDFMTYEMEQHIRELKQMESEKSFEEKFDFLLNLIFNKKDLHQLIGAAQQIIANSNEQMNNHKKRLEKLPLEMYRYLQAFIFQGKKEGKLKAELPDSLILGFIFQSIAIPNHYRIPQEEWVSSIKEIISHGMFKR